MCSLGSEAFQCQQEGLGPSAPARPAGALEISGEPGAHAPQLPEHLPGEGCPTRVEIVLGPACPFPDPFCVSGQDSRDPEEKL